MISPFLGKYNERYFISSRKCESWLSALIQLNVKDGKKGKKIVTSLEMSLFLSFG